jgi:hypothetical protein
VLHPAPGGRPDHGREYLFNFDHQRNSLFCQHVP